MPDQRKDLCVGPSVRYEPLACQRRTFTVKCKTLYHGPQGPAALVPVYTCTLRLTRLLPALWHAFCIFEEHVLFCHGDFALAAPSS